MKLKAGEAIPGSRYVRAFCPSCGDPMRVSIPIFTSGAILPCLQCDTARQPTESTMRASSRSQAPCDGGENPNWHNAVRSMEENR